LQEENITLSEAIVLTKLLLSRLRQALKNFNKLLNGNFSTREEGLAKAEELLNELRLYRLMLLKLAKVYSMYETGEGESVVADIEDIVDDIESMESALAKFQLLLSGSKTLRDILARERAGDRVGQGYEGVGSS